MMIEQIDKRLRVWVEGVLGAVTLSFAPPRDLQASGEVNLYLFELVDQPALRGPKRPPLQLSLRYLVTTWAEQPEEAHRHLGALVFAAMEHGEFEVELEPLPAAAWTAFGVAPHPSFVLRVPLRLERPEPAARLVRKPLAVQVAEPLSLDGVILGPDDVPLDGVQVAAPDLQRSIRTDRHGRFSFAMVPAEPQIRLCIRAKGHEMLVTVPRPVTVGEPLVIHFAPPDWKEG